MTESEETVDQEPTPEPKPKPRIRRFDAVREDEDIQGVAYLISRSEEGGDTFGGWRRWGMENWARLTPTGGPSWGELEQFVIDFSWVNEAFGAMVRPCWMLHPAVVEIISMLYFGRTTYEAERTKMSMRGHADHLAATDALVAALGEASRGHGDYCGAEHGQDGVEYAVHVDGDFDWVKREGQFVKGWVGMPAPEMPLFAVVQHSELAAELTEDGELDVALDLSEDYSRSSDDHHERGAGLHP